MLLEEGPPIPASGVGKSELHVQGELVLRLISYFMQRVIEFRPVDGVR